MTAPAPDIATQKTSLEIEKLRAEIAGLRRPFTRNPATLVAIASLLGMGIQYGFSQRSYQLAEIKAQQAQLSVQSARLDLASVQRLRQDADSALRAASSALDTLKHARKLAQDQLNRVQGSLKAAQAALASAGSKPAQADSALANARRSADSLESIGDRAAQVTATASRSIDSVSAHYSKWSPYVFTSSWEDILAPENWLRIHLSRRAVLHLTYLEPFGLLFAYNNPAGDSGTVSFRLNGPAKVQVDAQDVHTGKTETRVADCRKGSCSVEF